MWPFRRFVPNEETLQAFEEAAAYDRGEIELDEWTPHACVGSCDAIRRYAVTETASYKRDVERLEDQGADLEELYYVIEVLSHGDPLSPRFKDHKLKGEWRGKRECHIEPDWILVYEIKERELILHLVRPGSHVGVLGRRPRGRTGSRRSRGLAEKALRNAGVPRPNGKG